MARITSSPTTLTVTNLPAWLPPKGSWGQVALPASVPRARLDSIVAGDFRKNGNGPGPNRNMGYNGMSWDFNGAIWNPHLGTWGAWCIRGGGHATHWGMLDTGMYIWNADTRLWERFADPVYPGDIPDAPPYGWGQAEVMSELPSPAYDILKLYGEVTANPTDGYTPAADHNRWLPTLVPPGKWGMGSKGGMAIPAASSYHWANGSQSYQGHIFSFDTKKWVRLGNLKAYDSGRMGAATIDVEGNIYRRLSYKIERLAHNASSWTTLIQNETTALNEWGPIGYVPGDHLLAGTTGTSTAGNLKFWVVDLANPSSILFPGGGLGYNGVALSYPGVGVEPYTGITWCSDLNGFVTWSPENLAVYLFTRPANPRAQAWSVTQLKADNAPTLSFTRGQMGFGYYNRFQYSPILKAFFVCGDATTDGMWCFRPAEI